MSATIFKSSMLKKIDGWEELYTSNRINSFIAKNNKITKRRLPAVSRYFLYFDWFLIKACGVLKYR